MISKLEATFYFLPSLHTQPEDLSPNLNGNFDFFFTFGLFLNLYK